MAYYSLETPPERELTDSSGTGFYSSRWDLIPQAYAGLGVDEMVPADKPIGKGLLLAGVAVAVVGAFVIWRKPG